jgi:hypothetical protein
MSTQGHIERLAGLYLARVDWLGTAVGSCEAFKRLAPDGNIEALPSKLKVIFLYSEGHNFRMGPFVPAWDWDTAELAYPPGIGELLVLEIHQSKEGEGARYFGSPWGFHQQFLKVANEMERHSLYRLHVLTARGWRNSVWVGRDLSDLAARANMLMVQLSIAGLNPRIRLEMAVNGKWVRQPQRFFYELRMLGPESFVPRRESASCLA